MSLFDGYARYYDLLYKDKDCIAEAAYIDSLIRKYAPDSRRILDIGCGTGRHDFLLAEKGYSVTGVDISQKMIEKALSGLKTSSAKNIDFVHSDIRGIQLGRQYDAVISLFHVMSYQLSNDDIRAVLSTAGEHLSSNGIFVFDCWYGPAVLSIRPEIRMKKVDQADIKVLRIAEPLMLPNENSVDVNYTVLMIDKETGKTEEVRETHCMRYFFKPEIDSFFSETGFELIHFAEWMTDNSPGCDTWGVCFIGRKK